ncbi:MAG: hypothetical protein L0H93_05460 [Nocardioides sp.]|nr:hypothetical protein [Nocardioides sp.]
MPESLAEDRLDERATTASVCGLVMGLPSRPAPLAVLEFKGTDTQAFVDAVEELGNMVAHHIGEK